MSRSTYILTALLSTTLAFGCTEESGQVALAVNTAPTGPTTDTSKAFVTVTVATPITGNAAAERSSVAYFLRIDGLPLKAFADGTSQTPSPHLSTTTNATMSFTIDAGEYDFGLVNREGDITYLNDLRVNLKGGVANHIIAYGQDDNTLASKILVDDHKKSTLRVMNLMGDQEPVDVISCPGKVESISDACTTATSVAYGDTSEFELPINDTTFIERSKPEGYPADAGRNAQRVEQHPLSQELTEAGYSMVLTVAPHHQWSPTDPDCALCTSEFRLDNELSE